jgi:mersacidin/lichenicidin family type 2 lantibiotic
MHKVDIVRAWKDEEYRLSLSEEERRQLPPHPAGLIELDEAQLASARGHRGNVTHPIFTCQPVHCF